MSPHPWKQQTLLTCVFVLVAAVAAGAGVLVHRLNVSPAPASSLPLVAPPLAALWAAEFKDLSGQPVKMSDFKGQPLVVNFWATWCGPCIEEMPDFQRASRTAAGQKVKFIGIGIDYADKMKLFADKIGITYTLLESGAQGLDIVKASGNPSGALPFTLIVDRNGALIAQKLGKLEYAELMAKLIGL